MDKLKYIHGNMKTVNAQVKNLSLGKHILKRKCIPCTKEWIEKTQPIVIVKGHKQLKG